MEQLLRKGLEKVLSLMSKRDKILGFTIVLVTEKHYIELWRHKKESALLVDYEIHVNKPIPLGDDGEEIPET